MLDGENDCNKDTVSDVGVFSAVRKAVDIFRVLIQSDAAPEKIKATVKSLEQECRRTLELHSERENSTRGLTYGLLAAIGGAMRYLIERKRNGQNLVINYEAMNVTDAQSNDEQDDESESEQDTTDGNHDDGCGSAKTVLKKHPISIHSGKLAKFQCDTCGKIYSGRGALHKHKKTHLENEESRLPFKCEECGRRFGSPSHLERHKKSHEYKLFIMNNPKPKKVAPDSFECDICGKIYTNMASFRWHRRTHLDGPQKCDECGKEFAHMSLLRNHKQTHLPENERKRECSICGKVMTKHSLLTHMRLHKDDEKARLPYECTDCGKRFAQSGSLIQHKRIHLPPDHPLRKLPSDNLECPICNNIFKLKGALQVHMRCHEENEEARLPFKCEECGRRFPKKASLERHGRTHWAENDPRRQDHECLKCGKFLSSSKVLKEHEKTHLDENDPEQAMAKRPFKCEECGTSFRNKTNLKMHINRTHKNEPGKRPYQCVICGQRFPRPSDLQRHANNHLADDDPRKVKFDCEICGKTLNTKAGFEAHQLAHLSDNDPRRERYTCDICGKFLAGSGALALHKETHLDENDPGQAELKRPHKCDDCGMAFRTARNLRLHLNRHMERHKNQRSLRFGLDKTKNNGMDEEDDYDESNENDEDDG